MNRGGASQVTEQDVADADDFADFAEFEDPAETAARIALRATTRAKKSASRCHARRCDSQAALANVLPPTIDPGETWHVISTGDIDSLSYARHFLSQHPADWSLVSTWCLGIQDADQLRDWLQTGTIKQLDLYGGEYLAGRHGGAAFATACDAVRAHAGRVVTFNNHAKLIMLHSRATGACITVQTSANVTTNPRVEQACISADPGLFMHHKAFFDAMPSRAGTWATWAPYDPAA